MNDWAGSDNLPADLNGHRPRYHLLPPAGWLNDPNGPLFWEGKYHLFYQFSPEVNPPGPKLWAHAVSGDLVHWEHEPVALSPTAGGPDAEGCWSGSAAVDGDTPVLVYTGVFPEVQCLATSEDGMRTWQKHPRNSVVAGPPEGLEVTGFRDPCVWREGGEWLMIVGSGLRGVGGTALLYRSADLVAWEYLHPLCVGVAAETGEMWECPDFFPLGDRHVLAAAPYGTPLYMIGGYQDRRFQAHRRGELDASPLFYAPKTMRDGQGRRLMWGWIMEDRPGKEAAEAGWSGVMSLPRVLELDPTGALTMRPAPELEGLRGRGVRWEGVRLGAGQSLALGQGRQLEVALEAAPGAELDLTLAASPGGEEGTVLAWRDGCLSLERGGGRLPVGQAPRTLSVARPAEEGLRLRVFLDGSVLEVFLNERACLTGRLYPARADSQRALLTARGREVRVRRAEVWEMGSIW